jgi:hypothetical protein
MYKQLLLLVLSACGTPEAPQWMEHPCGNGDPVQIACIDEEDTVWEEPSTDLCEDLDILDGDECATVDETCVRTQAFTCISTGEAQRSREELLTCRDEPYDEDSICPASSRAFKRDIVYVGPSEHQALAKQVLDVKLARYNYIDPKKPGRKLGYILEDLPEASFSSGEHVDMYAYVSAVVALTQQQQAEIERLRQELEALKKQR